MFVSLTISVIDFDLTIAQSNMLIVSLSDKAIRMAFLSLSFIIIMLVPYLVLWQKLRQNKFYTNSYHNPQNYLYIHSKFVSEDHSFFEEIDLINSLVPWTVPTTEDPVLLMT